MPHDTLPELIELQKNLDALEDLILRVEFVTIEIRKLVGT